MPDNIDKTLNMAIIATNAEREKAKANRQDRGPNVRVFTERGRRGHTPGNNYSRYDGPQGKLQWSNRGAWSQPKAGLTRYWNRVDGTYSHRIDSRTPFRSEEQV